LNKIKQLRRQARNTKTKQARQHKQIIRQAITTKMKQARQT
jgi:hypothetical protein